MEQGGLCGQGSGEREFEHVVAVQLWPDESGEIEAAVGFRVPGVAAATATRGLLVGDVDLAARCTCGSVGEGAGLGGVDGGKVVELAGEDRAGEGGIDRREVERANRHRR